MIAGRGGEEKSGVSTLPRGDGAVNPIALPNGLDYHLTSRSVT